jgi:hypothetical protein
LTALDNRLRIISNTHSRLQRQENTLRDSVSQHDALNLTVGSTSHARIHARLPKIEIRPFSGDKSEWIEFWDSFSNAIDDNADLVDIDKFNYLRSFLKAEARDMLMGLSLSSLNYPIAVKLLKDKYGKKEVLLEHLDRKLFSLKPCESFKDCKSMVSEFEKICRQMEAAGVDIDDNTQVWRGIMVKLSKRVMARLLEIKASSATWNTTIMRKELNKILEIEEELEENFSFAHPKQQKGNSVNSKNNKNKDKGESSANSDPTVAFATVKPQSRGGKSNYICKLCDGKHTIFRCDRYKSVDDRWKRLKELKICPRCLKTGHFAKNCESNINCNHCQKEHRIAFCSQFEKEKASKSSSTIGAAVSKQDNPDSQDEESSEQQEVTAAVKTGNMSETKTTLFMCARVYAFNPLKPKVRTLANVFVDSMSSRSFLTDDLAHKLNLKIEKSEKFPLGVFGSEATTFITSDIVQVGIVSEFGENLSIKANTKKLLTIATPAATIRPKDLDLEKIENQGVKIDWLKPDILLGIDQFHNLDVKEVKKLTSGFVLSSSKIGMFVSGVGKAQQIPNNPSVVHSLPVVTFINEEYDSTDKRVNDFFSLESIGINEPEDKGFEDNMVLENFKKNLKHNGERYQVSFPWVNPIPTLPTNYPLAWGRLVSLIRTNQIKRPEILVEYDKIIKDQISKDIVEVIKDPFSSKNVLHYIPHQAVIKQDKSYTKVRIVYDASARLTKSSNSLNDCLYKGPDLSSNLFGMILRSRFFKILITSDVEKAFLQVEISPSDRDSTRFLWIKDIQKPVSKESGFKVIFLR